MVKPPRKSEASMFFFEKKNQKTFDFLGVRARGFPHKEAGDKCPTPVHES
jgi:hypothetical protein